MTIELYNRTNEGFAYDYKFDLVYSDMIYEDKNILDWLKPAWQALKINGILIVQTDFHTDWLVRWYLETNSWFEAVRKPVFVNDLKWLNEWGNHPKNKMHQCFDSLIIYAKGNDYKFYSDRIQVDKKTKNTKLNPSGRQTKTATAWIDDICLTTTAKERIKKSDGHLIKWQKPIALMERILSPFTDEGDWIYENFGGTFPACRWAKMNNRNAVGVELDVETFKIGKGEVDAIPV